MAAAKRLWGHARRAASMDLDRGERLSGAEGPEAPAQELPQDIHTFAILLVLADNAGNWTLLKSLLCVLAQLVLLAVICSDTCTPACTGDGQCSLGQWCGPNYISHNAYPGQCLDCFEAYAMYNSSLGRPTVDHGWQLEPLRFAARAAALGKERLAAAVDHCDLTDTMPLQCDYVLHNRMALSGGSLLVLWATVAMVALSVMEDMNEAGVGLVLLAQMLRRSVDAPPSCAVLALLWCIFTMRLFFLPVAVAVTTTAVLVTGSQTATNILMNGLVLTVVVTLDDVVRQLVPRRFAKRAEALAASPLVADCLAFAREGHWRDCHTGMALFVGGLIPIICMNVNYLLSTGLVTNIPLGQLCTGLVALLLRITCVGAVIVSFLRPLIWWNGPCLMVHLLPSWNEKLVITIEALVSPLFNLLIAWLTSIVGQLVHYTHI